MRHIYLLLILQFYTVICNGQDTAYAHEVVRTLSSQEYKGRGYVEDGQEKAASYIAQQYAKAGLKAFFDEDDNEERFFQSFTIRVNTFPSAMQLKVDGAELKAGSEYLVHPSSSSAKGRFDIYRIEKSRLTEPEIINTILSESKRKFLLIDARNTSFQDKADESKANDVIGFLSYNNRIPSKGTLIMTDEKLTWSISKKRENKPLILINSKSKESPGTVSLHIKSVYRNHSTQNVIGYVPGVQVPDSFLFVIAHYDHLGMMGSEVYFPGANDNASGIAMMLNLVKYYSLNPHRYTIVFAAMAAEESGLDGSRYFVEHSPVDLKKSVFLVNFDLAGTGEKGIKVVNGTLYNKQFELLKSLNTAGGYLHDVQVRGPACNSDHCPFHEKGVKCFYIYTMGGSTAYHDIHDTYEALSLNNFTGYFRLMTKFINNL